MGNVVEGDDSSFVEFRERCRGKGYSVALYVHVGIDVELILVGRLITVEDDWCCVGDLSICIGDIEGGE